MDEPMFTQPLMYQRIRKHPNVFKIYSDKLLEEGLVKKEDIQVSQVMNVVFVMKQINNSRLVATHQSSHCDAFNL